MKRLLFLGLVAFAAWYGYKHYAELKQLGSHDVVASNHSGHGIERLRISVADQTVVVEALADGEDRRVPLRADRDGTFSLVWETSNAPGERMWSGGTFTHGPMLMEYRFEFHGDDGVIWSSRPKPHR